MPKENAIGKGFAFKADLSFWILRKYFNLNRQVCIEYMMLYSAYKKGFEDTLQQAKSFSYFKQHTAYNKLFAAMRKKYTTRGQLRGVFVLDDLTI